MGILNRPYAGTWEPNRRVITQWTPDAVVYLNGDTSLPGCQTCHHNIDIAQFVTGITTDSGVEPGASNASISLSIPKFYGDSLFRDGNTLLAPGLEVHITFRGFFPMTGLATDTERAGGVELGNIPQHPYYPVFHGVVTKVDHDYSGGYFSASLTCNGMLHFWEYLKVSSSGSFFGSRPTNSRIRTTLTGHPFHGMTPYAIIYNLFRDTVGAAAGVGFALQSRTNFGAVSATTGDSLYTLTTQYWERRFRDRIYGLRMHGAGGSLFTSAQQAYLSRYRTSGSAGHLISANLSPRTGRGARDIYAQDASLLLGLADRSPDGRILRQPDLSVLPSAGGGSHGLNVTQMQAYTTDISAFGQVNLFESTYESKLDIVNQVVLVTGFEFYQDVDGDLVFKPPLYNLDTSSSRVYRIEPEDVESFQAGSAEPEATYAIVKAGAFANMQGVVDQAEFGVRSVYVNYPLVAQFGWREHSVETSYYNNARSAFFMGVAQLDRINAGVHSASVTIPLRPEIRPGYPVYIVHLDCYYYVQSVSHSFSFGSHCSTTLQLTARRRKFMPPGDPRVPGIRGVDLAGTHLPPKALQGLTNDRVPKLVGFPNVVMSLDPTTLNPLFYVYGFGAEEESLMSRDSGTQSRNREIFITSFIRSLWERGVFAVRGSESTRAVDPFGGDPNQEFYIPRDGFSDITFTFSDMRDALASFISLRRASRTAIRRVTRDLQRAIAAENPDQTEINRLQTILNTLNGFFDPSAPESNRTSVRAEFLSATRAITDAGRPPSDHTLRYPENGTLSRAQENITLISYLIGTVRMARPGSASSDMQFDATGTINESAAILELLNDRKASMGVTTPGVYRYYSSSHPNPEQQGPEPIDRAVATETGDSLSEGSTASQDTTLPPSQRYPPTVTSLTGRVAGQQTTLSPTQAVSYLRNAWARLRGDQPSDAVLAVLTAQWALESGRGDSMYNFNFGGVKVGRRWSGGQVLLGTTEGVDRQRTERYFRAYGSFEEGAYDYVRNLLVNHTEAIERVVQTGDTGAFTAGNALNSYHTGPQEDYVRNIRGYVAQARREWLGGSQANGGEDETTTAPSSPSATVTIPPSELECTLVQPASETEGLPEDVAQGLVSFGVHIPTNGLRVRTAVSANARVVPTSQIRTLTFDQRTVPRVTNRPTVTLRDGTTPAQAIAFFRSCLSGNPGIVSALGSSLASSLPAGGLTTVRPTADLVTAAVNGITGIMDAQGHPLTSTNFASGAPNNTTTVTGNVTGADVARRVLNDKARVLVQELTTAHRSAFEFAVTSLQNLPAGSEHAPIPAEVVARLRRWNEGLAALFRGHGVPRSIPFQSVRGSHFVNETIPSWSPVFPISDERGYEHYGALQYGRGLSIESGGNYEALMSTDPLQYADPALVDRFVAALSHTSLRDSDGNLELPSSARDAIRAIASSSGFADSIGGRSALRFTDSSVNPTTDRVAQIANGLANYILSNRDATMKLTPNNVAQRLVDLQPLGDNDTCSCRGAEADLLVAAYMAGAEDTTFVSVDDTDAAIRWETAQMARSADLWSRTQNALRGTRASASEGAVSLASLENVVDEIGAAGSAATSQIENAVNQGTALLGSLASRIGE